MAENAPEQIIINGQEYSLEDASRLVELGKGREQIEKELNTSIDKVYPEFTKTTQAKKDLEEKLSTAEKELAEFRVKQAKDTETPTDIKKARQAARELGLADEDWLNEQGYVRKTDLDEYFSQKQTQQAMADRILKDCAKYEKELDGSDGRVPFDTDAVLTYASVKQIADPMEAYKQMNKRGNSKWEEAELAKVEAKGMTTLKPGGVKTPAKPKVNNDNLGAQLGEMLTELNIGN